MGLSSGGSYSRFDRKNGRPGFSSSTYESQQPINIYVENKIIQPKLPNPDPSNYEVMEHEQIGKFLVIQLRYPDCVNYEGIKIMVFECRIDQLLAQKMIDPHFSENEKYYSPIARFEPTVRGWRHAINFATSLSKDDR